MNSFVKGPMVYDDAKDGLHSLFGFAYEDYLAELMADAEASNREWFKNYLKKKNIIGFILDDNDIDDNFCEVEDLVAILTDKNTAMYVIGLETLSEGRYLTEDNIETLKHIFKQYGFSELPNVYDRRLVFQRGLKDRE